MSRLSGSDNRGLMEAYASICNTQSQLNEEQQIEQFIYYVDTLVEEGYDITQYSYDELYEAYLNEFWGALGRAALKYGEKALKAGKSAARIAYRGTAKTPGAKEKLKNVVAKVGQMAVPVGFAAALDQYLTGGKGREYAGAALKTARELGHSIPSPGKVADTVSPYIEAPSTAKTEPEKKKKPSSYNPLGLNQDVDMFDLVKGHLMSEGYADTEEAALAIMANMSEEWRQSIVENRGMAYSGGKPGASGDGSRPKGITGGKTYQMPGWEDKKQTKGA